MVYVVSRMFPCMAKPTQPSSQQSNHCRRVKPFLKMATRIVTSLKVLARPFVRCFSPAARPTAAGASQGTNTPDVMPVYPADGAILVPSALAASSTISANSTCFQGVIHLDSAEPASLCPAYGPPVNTISAVTAAAATQYRAADVLLCSELNGQQLTAQEDHHHLDSWVHSTGVVVDSILDDLVDDAVSHCSIATACAVDAAVDQLVSKAFCDAEAAYCDMIHKREAAMAVDTMLEDLVSSTVADAEAAQAQVVEVVLNQLISSAELDLEAAQTEVAGGEAAQPESVADLISDRAVETVLEQLVNDVLVDAQAESAVTSQLVCSGRVVNQRPVLSSTVRAHQVVGSALCAQPEVALGNASAPTQWLRREIEEIRRSVYVELYQEGWVDAKVKNLGQGPHWTTILSAPPLPLLSTAAPLSLPSTAAALPLASSAAPCVLKLALVDRAESTVSTSRLLAQEASIMHRCCHPNVVPVAFVGVQPPPQPCTPTDPTRVVYIATPWADISLEKRLGQEAWGRCTPNQGPRAAGGAYRGPALASLLEHGKAVVHALTHVHRCGVLHRGLTPDHLLLFSKQSAAAARAGREGVPRPIKFHLKLGGFGSAVQLDGQGCAMDYPPYRCGAGYTPPEAQEGNPLTPAADVYQFGGLCYFMAMGSHPPTLLPADHAPGMAEVLLPGLMPEEWRALVAACWATKPEDRPTVAQLQHQICSLQQRLRASRCTTSKAQNALQTSHTGELTTHEPTLSGSAAAAASQPVVLPKLLQGLNRWMPSPSIVHVPYAPERTSTNGQLVSSMQSLDTPLTETNTAGDGDTAAIHAGLRRGDSASETYWSWTAGLKGRSAALSAAFSKGVADVSAKTVDVMQQLADSQLSAKSANNKGSTGGVVLV